MYEVNISEIMSLEVWGVWRTDIWHLKEQALGDLTLFCIKLNLTLQLVAEETEQRKIRDLKIHHFMFLWNPKTTISHHARQLNFLSVYLVLKMFIFEKKLNTTNLHSIHVTY